MGALGLLIQEWGCAARFPKLSPYLRPECAIFIYCIYDLTKSKA